MKTVLLVFFFLCLEGTGAIVWFRDTPTAWFIPSTVSSPGNTWTLTGNLTDNSTTTCAFYRNNANLYTQFIILKYGTQLTNYISDLPYFAKTPVQYGAEMVFKTVEADIYSGLSPGTKTTAAHTIYLYSITFSRGTSDVVLDTQLRIAGNDLEIKRVQASTPVTVAPWRGLNSSQTNNIGLAWRFNSTLKPDTFFAACAGYLRARIDIPVTLYSVSPLYYYGPLDGATITANGGPFSPKLVIESTWNPTCHFTTGGNTLTTQAVNVTINRLFCPPPTYGTFTVQISFDGVGLKTDEVFSVTIKQCNSDIQDDNPNCPSNSKCLGGFCVCNAGYCGSQPVTQCNTCQCQSGCVHGNCVGPNNCTCNNKYYGAACDQFDCLIRNNCSGNGNCTAPDLCLCSSNFAGDNCTTPVIVTTGSTTGSTSTSKPPTSSTGSVTNPDTTASTSSGSTTESSAGAINSGADKGKDNKTLIIIIACVVGGFLLITILVIIIIVVVAKNRGKSDGVRFVPPDFNSIVYGKYLDLLYAPAQNKAAYKPFQNLLLQTGLQVATAIASTCPVTDKEHVSRALAHAFASSRESVTFLMRLIDIELESTVQETTLFRGNSISIAVFQVFSKIIATRYIWDLFGRYIAELDVASGQGRSANEDEEAPTDIRLSTIKNASSNAPTQTQDSSLFNDDALTLEVDPNKMGESTDDAAVNKYKLLLTTQKFFQRITSSASFIPSDISIILNYVADHVVRKFPEGKYKAVGGFFFLRLIVPSITTPHVYGLLPGPPGEITQRNLVLLAKVLQNLANQAHFGSKEEHMTKLNDFITENSDAVKKFFDQISVPPTNTNMPIIRIPENVEFNAILFLHNYCHNNRDKIMDKLKKNGQTNAAKELESVLDNLGAPAPLKK